MYTTRLQCVTTPGFDTKLASEGEIWGSGILSRVPSTCRRVEWGLPVWQLLKYVKSFMSFSLLGKFHSSSTRCICNTVNSQRGLFLLLLKAALNHSRKDRPATLLPRHSLQIFHPTPRNSFSFLPFVIHGHTHLAILCSH